MPALAALLAAALVASPLPPAKPVPPAPAAVEPAPGVDPGLQRLLDDVRRIRRSAPDRPQPAAPAPGADPASPLPDAAARPAVPVMPAAGEPPAGDAGAAPDSAPVPPRRGSPAADSSASAAEHATAGGDAAVRLVWGGPQGTALSSPLANAPVTQSAAPPAQALPAALALPQGDPVPATASAPSAATASRGRAPGAAPLPPHRLRRVGRSRAADATALRAFGSAATGAAATQPDRTPPAMALAPRPAAPAPPRDPICRDPRLSGTRIQQIVHESWPCGIAQPVRVNAISGIRLSSPVVLDCNTASRFASWLTGVADRSAREHLSRGIDRVWVMGSYACRTRNNRPGGKLSEHARGRAVDIGGVWLNDGTKVTLERSWGKGAEGRFLKQIRGRACGLFHTVLGPGSDRHHDDHLHLDTSPRGGKPYCR